MDISTDNNTDINIIPKCCILGVNIAAININKAVSLIGSNIKRLSGKYICVSNVHTTVTGYHNSDFREIQNNAAMAIPDGKPLEIIAKKRGFGGISRIAGPDLMHEIFIRSSISGYKHFFLGSTDETLKKLNVSLRIKYPGIDIAGMYSPPFRPLCKEEDAAIINMINKAEPDFVWVGLGAPKQEMWMRAHQDRIKGLMIGVGAGFDYHAGNLSRAPKWMQSLSLEWLYRLLQEPGRLLGRYMTTNIRFLWLLSRGK